MEVGDGYRLLEVGEGYRLLVDGEKIELGDEFRSFRESKWKQCVGWLGAAWTADVFHPMRRRVPIESRSRFQEMAHRWKLSQTNLSELRVYTCGCGKHSIADGADPYAAHREWVAQQVVEREDYPPQHERAEPATIAVEIQHEDWV